MAVAVVALTAAGCNKGDLGLKTFSRTKLSDSIEFAINSGEGFSNSRKVSIVIAQAFSEGDEIRIGHRSDPGSAEPLPPDDVSCIFDDWVDAAALGGQSILEYDYELPASSNDGAFAICGQRRLAPYTPSLIQLMPVILDTQGPVLASQVPAELFHTIGTREAEVELKGTATDAIGISRLEFSLQFAATGLCLDRKLGRFTDDCPQWISIEPQSAWTIPLSSSLFQEEEFYNLSLKASDTAGNITDIPNLQEFEFFLVAALSANFSINYANPYTSEREVRVNLLAGARIGHYRIAEGPTCSDRDWQAYSQQSIVFTLSAGAGTKTICMQVKTVDGEVSSQASGTIILDQSPPTLAITATAATLDADTTAGAATTFSGTAVDAGSGVEQVLASVRDEASGLCLNGDKSSFSETCPEWLSAIGTAAWSFSLDDSLLQDGQSYTLMMSSTDKAGITLESDDIDNWPVKRVFAWDAGP